jgi:Zn-dependent oligopeptidase
MTYNVTDVATNATLGIMYIDLYAREGKDSGGYTIPLIDGARFWRTPNPTFESGSKAPLRDLNAWVTAAPLQLPVATLGLNQANPNAEGLAFMWLDEVAWLFHEFGHGLHHILTTTPYGLASGWRCGCTASYVNGRKARCNTVILSYLALCMCSMGAPQFHKIGRGRQRSVIQCCCPM